MKTPIAIVFGFFFLIQLSAKNAVCQIDDLAFTVWVEQPSIEKRANYFEEYYGGIVDFVECNPAGVEVNKLIVRFIDPLADFGAAGNPWNPDLSSVFITDLALQLPASREFVFLSQKVTQLPYRCCTPVTKLLSCTNHVLQSSLGFRPLTGFKSTIRINPNIRFVKHFRCRF